MLGYKQEWASVGDKDGATPLIHTANMGVVIREVQGWSLMPKAMFEPQIRDITRS